jgi:predicted Zn-dependent protease
LTGLLALALGGAVPAEAADRSAAALNALVKARIADEAGQPAEALAALTSLASLAPQLPGLRGRILEQAIEAGDLVAARGAAARLWADGDRRFDAMLVLLVDAMRRSDWKAARAYLSARSDKTGGDAALRLVQPGFQAWIDVGARAPEPERPLLAAAGQGRPEPAITMEAALVRLVSGRKSDAVELAEATVLTDRTSQLVALRLAATLDRAGESKAAKALRERTVLAAGVREDPLLLLPDQPVTSARGGGAHWIGLLADGLSRMPGSPPRAALLFARSAHWLDDRDWTAQSALVEVLGRGGRERAALALLETERATLPPVLEMRRAELLAETGNPGAAVRLAEAAVRNDPAPRSLLIRFADVARRADDPIATARAYARLEASLGDRREDEALRGTLLIARAELLLQADDWDGARPLLEKAVTLRPDDPEILNFAGYSALERRKDVAGALARIEAAWQREPQSAAITDSLGWAYFLTGRVDKAVPLLEKAERGDPENAVIVEHLGDAYWQAGRRFEARNTWRAAMPLAEDAMTARLSAKLADGLTPATTAP